MAYDALVPPPASGRDQIRNSSFSALLDLVPFGPAPEFGLVFSESDYLFDLFEVHCMQPAQRSHRSKRRVTGYASKQFICHSNWNNAVVTNRDRLKIGHAACAGEVA